MGIVILFQRISITVQKIVISDKKKKKKLTSNILQDVLNSLKYFRFKKEACTVKSRLGSFHTFPPLPTLHRLSSLGLPGLTSNLTTQARALDGSMAAPWLFFRAFSLFVFISLYHEVFKFTAKMISFNTQPNERTNERSSDAQRQSVKLAQPHCDRSATPRSSNLQLSY